MTYLYMDPHPHPPAAHNTPFGYSDDPKKTLTHALSCFSPPPPPPLPPSSQFGLHRRFPFWGGILWDDHGSSPQGRQHIRAPEVQFFCDNKFAVCGRLRQRTHQTVDGTVRRYERR